MSQKGAVWERRWCVSLSKWFSKGSRDDLFWRTSGSGARATTRARKGRTLTKYEYGDMTHVCPEGQPFTDLFSVEMRSRRDLKVLGVVYEMDPSLSLLSWWAKATRDAELSGRVPVLLTHVTRGKDMIWTPTSLWDIVQQWSRPVVRIDFECGPQTVRVDPGRQKVSDYFLAGCEVTGRLFEEFVAEVDPDSLVSVDVGHLPVPKSKWEM